jgi:NAD(P)-dependent dehydrogenase (short-subunit alcohol dehydrogenase family)
MAKRTTVLVLGAGNIGGEVIRQLGARTDVSIVTASFDPSDKADALCDIGDVESLRKLDASFPNGVDHVVVCCGASIFGPIADFDSKKWEQNCMSKLVAVSRLIIMLANGKELKLLHDGGGVTVTAGQASRTINKMWPGIAVNNSGLEAFVKCAGLDAPRGVRINAVAPAMIRETAARSGNSIEGTVSAADAAAHYLPLIFGTMTGQVVDAGSQTVFTKSHHDGMKDNHGLDTRARL